MENEIVNRQWQYSTFAKSLIESPDHILIAGMTGAGKSTFMNNMLNSILMESPDEHSIILIDPKCMEFYPYEHTPHCIALAEEYEDIIQVLRATYNLIKMRGKEVRESGTYDKTYTGTKVHLFIDELADLMLQKRDNRAAILIQQILQIARAANVQVICATQNPLREVIPTGIKINCGIIIGLKTRNAQDSRNILGENGCEMLPRRGKALVRDPDHQETHLVDIPKIPEEQILRLIKYREEGN